jgi:hypothetical protein
MLAIISARGSTACKQTVIQWQTQVNHHCETELGQVLWLCVQGIFFCFCRSGYHIQGILSVRGAFNPKWDLLPLSLVWFNNVIQNARLQSQ